jgi:hypothetical protein
MDHQLLCTWLGLPADRWPHDHYTLLGLEPGETDVERIHQHVHDRHEQLRRYQLTYPDQVTEGMTRLAQAFDCLTNVESKRAYDAALFPARSPEVPSASPPEADPLGWLFGPWNQMLPAPPPEAAPLRLDWVASPPPPRAVPPAHVTTVHQLSLATLKMLDAETSPASAEAPPIEPFIPELLPEPDDPVAVTARAPDARRGLGTRRALLQRITQTRKLLIAWNQTGKILGDVESALIRRSEAVELVRQLSLIRQLLQGFPPLLGQAGQPGYAVIALARQQSILQTFQSLSLRQREVLARHWRQGHDLLLAHRDFLREELQILRRKSRWSRALRMVRHFLYEYPITWLLPLALVALNLSSPSWRALWPVQVLALVAVVVVFAVIKTNQTTAKTWLDRTRR